MSSVYFSFLCEVFFPPFGSLFSFRHISHWPDVVKLSAFPDSAFE